MCRAIILLVLIVPSPVLAGLSPESVALVVNGDSWASLTVANEYARLRHVPPTNFIVLSNLSSFDKTDVERFRTEVLAPVFAAIEHRGLTQQIDCIAYSLDIPYSVGLGPDLKGYPFPDILTPVAAANGLTYLHEWVLKKDLGYLGLDGNRYARHTLPLVKGIPLTTEEQAEYNRAIALYDARKFAEAAEVLRTLTQVKRTETRLVYDLAACLARAGKADEAMTALREAVSVGWRNHGQAATDRDLRSLAGRADFQELVEQMRSAAAQVQKTRGFRASYRWTDAGRPGKSGPRYMLSTMLGVASGRGNSVEEVLESLRRSAAADGSHPSGTIYFLKNADIRSTVRDWAFVSAKAELEKLGVRCVIEEGVLPRAHPDVAGAVVGIADFDWADSRSRILPGAICEHLTSCGGMLGERDGQTPCTDFIRAGAAGSSGTVTEPFTMQEKFPNAFMHVHYVRGSTLAEAFYQSLLGPYQLLIIGDPLCRPWGSSGRVALRDVAAGARLSGAVKLRAICGGGPAGVADFVLCVDGRRAVSGSPDEALTLDTTQLADGEHILSVVVTHKDRIETRSRMEMDVTVANGGRRVNVEKSAAGPVRFGETVSLRVACAEAESVDVRHLGRVVGNLQGAEGEIKIESVRLGTGHAVLQPIARLAGGGEVYGVPIDVEISAPSAIEPTPPPGKAKLARGLALAIAGGAPVVITDTAAAEWLVRAGAGEGRPFELSGYFDAPKAELYQVQIRTNTRAEVKIGDVQVLKAAGDGWQYAPVRLVAGTHALRVSGLAPNDAHLDLRIGAAGAARPDGNRFRCVAGR